MKTVKLNDDTHAIVKITAQATNQTIITVVDSLIRYAIVEEAK